MVITYNVVNPKSPIVYYSYRINSTDNGTWSPWSTEKSTIIGNSLGPGKYKLEIRASFNRKTSSPVQIIDIEVKTSFFKSEGFVGGLILVLLIFNVGYLIRRKQFGPDQVLLTKDMNLQAKSAGVLLLFGGLAIISIFNIAPRVLTDLIYFPIFTTITGGITILLGLSVFLFSSIRKAAHKITIVGFLLVLGYNLVCTQLSYLHPYYVIGIILTLMVTSIVITKFSQVISVCIIVLASSFFIVYTVEGDLLFNDVFFIADMFTTVFLVIITTYSKNDTLEKLMFTSGVINNDDFLVAAFKPTKEITYLNETFKSLLPKNLEFYVGKNLDQLNRIETFGEQDFDKLILDEFKDKHLFNVSLELNSGELRHFQFACKVFKDDLRVIIGQDITEKIELEKYYEVIVNNSQDLIYRLDVSGHFTFINKQSEKILGVKSHELMGQFYTSVVHPEWAEEVVDFYSHQFKSKIKNTYSEIPILTKTGKVIWLGQHMTAIFKEGDEKVITGYLGIGRNITDRKKKDEIISDQNKDIRDSLNYAKRIQMNLLPEERKIAHFFKESFVYYLPKDIVSGDFYWVEQLDNKTIIINADCTGHGVPGAFMTLLGINLLNQIILENKIVNAGEILNELDARLNQSLRRNKSEDLNDGIECTVCIIDENEDVLEYALAGSKFLLHQNNKITELSGRSSHIGEGTAAHQPFESIIIPFHEDDVIYLYSDGITDQFGGEKGKKLKKSRFINLIDQLKHESLDVQHDEIRSYMENWMKNEEQTDDICLIAVKRNASNKL